VFLTGAGSVVILAPMDEPITTQALQEALGTRYVGRSAECHDEIGSTNARAAEWARAGAPDGALVCAEVQTAGRGRLDRRWHAPRGSSLLMSLILRPPLAPRQSQRMTMIVSLAAVEAIHRVAGLAARVKWPNDVYLAEHKVGGILTELGVRGETLAHVVVGLGLNVNLDVSALPEVATPATSLSAALGRPVARLPLLAAILDGVERRYDRLRAGWSPAEEWREHLLTVGRRVTVRGGEGETLEGLAEGVDADGALLVRDAGGTLHRIHAGDVTLRVR